MEYYKLENISFDSDKVRQLKIAGTNREIFKAVASRQEWFYHNGLYDFSTMLRNSFFEFGLIPIHDYSSLFHNFIMHEDFLSEHFKAIRYGDKDIFMFSEYSGMFKKGRTFSVYPLLLINEDIFNIYMIKNGRFSSVTKDDLREYAQYFVLDNTLVSEIGVSEIQELCSDIQSLEKLKEFTLQLTRESEFVKALRKK